MPEHLSPESLERDLAVRDLTDESAGPHALQLLVALATAGIALRRLPGIDDLPHRLGDVDRGRARSEDGGHARDFREAHGPSASAMAFRVEDGAWRLFHDQITALPMEAAE